MDPRGDSGSVSIVIPTFQRRDRLVLCLDKIRRNIRIDKEIIIVDGGSTDGSREFLAKQNDCRVILETAREGAVKAFNKGFQAATGTYIMWLNDDAWPLPGAVDSAVDMIRRPDLLDVGMVAFYHNWRNDRNVLDRISKDRETFELCHVRGYPYANFGLLRRDLLREIGFADERYYFNGFDPDLSLTIQINKGLKVIGCRSALIAHDEFADERRASDASRGANDNASLFAKWSLPSPGDYPDPAPQYKKMLAERGLLSEQS